MTRFIPVASLICGLAVALAPGAIASTRDDAIRHAMEGKNGAFVLVDCATGELSESAADAAAKRWPPCSTFKIWNALLGIEGGLLTAANQPFYQWDGVERPVATWNRDLNLRDAFQASCVPAFQALAKQLGAARMNPWLEKLDYGDRNSAAGIDVFWLPAPGRASILISPGEQAELLRKLVKGKLPVAEKSTLLLKELMLVKTTDRGVLFGKTGGGTLESTPLGWFVGFVESEGKTFAFAAQLHGVKATGAEARALTEAILTKLEFF